MIGSDYARLGQALNPSVFQTENRSKTMAKLESQAWRTLIWIIYNTIITHV